MARILKRRLEKQINQYACVTGNMQQILNTDCWRGTALSLGL